MKNSTHPFVVLAAAAIASTAIAFTMQAANLSDKETEFLAGYEKVRAALAADDLIAAKRATAEMGPDGTTIAQSKSITDARSAFEKASDKAETLAAGQASYFILHCPMAGKDWVQISTKPSNPYLGRQMASCGEMKK